MNVGVPSEAAAGVGLDLAGADLVGSDLVRTLFFHRAVNSHASP